MKQKTLSIVEDDLRVEFRAIQALNKVIVMNGFDIQAIVTELRVYGLIFNKNPHIINRHA